VGLEIDVERPLGGYPPACQQLVTIARAIDLDARLLIMDEPTSSLERGEVLRLFALLERLKQDRRAIVFIGHDLDEIFTVSDRITVLREGRRVGSFPTAELSRLELVSCMLGRTVDPDARQSRSPRSRTSPGEEIPDQEVPPLETPALETRKLARAGALEPIDLRLGRGEVLGLVGLLGSGRTEVLRLVFGADRASGGEVLVEGRELSRLTPRRAVRAGLALCPEDRRAEGIFPDLSVRENIAIVVQRTLSPLGLVSRRRQEELAERLVRRLGIACASTAQAVRTLSGGNQQKVILARWIATDPRVLLLDEPTRGIDIGAKSEALELIGEIAGEGCSVLLVSSTLEEVLRTAGRVVVLHGGAEVRQIEGPDFDEREVVEAMAGGGKA
jgi:galactofuranose transport system ATP-binding protein